MIQVGPNDAFCCANMPTTVTFVKTGEQLVYRELANATEIDASAVTAPVSAFVVQPTAYDNSVPPSGQGEPKHSSPGRLATSPAWRSLPIPAAAMCRSTPAAAYQAIWDEAGDPFVADTLAALQTLLSERPANPAPPLPVLPQIPPRPTTSPRRLPLDLADGGAGVRFVGRFAQDVSPIENFQLRYIFQGLSGDGQFLNHGAAPDHDDGAACRAAVDGWRCLQRIRRRLRQLSRQRRRPSTRWLPLTLRPTWRRSTPCCSR